MSTLTQTRLPDGDKKPLWDYMFVGVEPQPKERPRSGWKTPRKTATWEDMLRNCAREDSPPVPFEQRLDVRIHFVSTKHIGDLDNCIKTVLDALNKIAWKDDKQIDRIDALRTVCADGQRPKIVVTIFEMVNTA